MRHHRVQKDLSKCVFLKVRKGIDVVNYLIGKKSVSCFQETDVDIPYTVHLHYGNTGCGVFKRGTQN